MIGKPPRVYGGIISTHGKFIMGENEGAKVSGRECKGNRNEGR